MLTPFKLGVGGPIAGGRQYMPWIHVDDVVGAYLFAIDNDEATGPINLSAPEPVTNKEFSKALGKVLHRPAFAPVPGLAIKALYGEMATIVTTGARMVPNRLETLGYDFRRPGAGRGAGGRGRLGLVLEPGGGGASTAPARGARRFATSSPAWRARGARG